MSNHLTLKIYYLKFPKEGGNSSQFTEKNK